jgi:hypothetical protein
MLFLVWVAAHPIAKKIAGRGINSVPVRYGIVMLLCDPGSMPH